MKTALLHALDALGDGTSSAAVMAALLRSGELECSIADSGHAYPLPFAQLTDCLAETLLRGAVPASFHEIKNAALSAAAPEQVELSTPEGFAYYALHPLAYAQAWEKLPDLPENILVAGIRSIGSTLSAVTAAAARLRGRNARRITVRPGGHPYDRKTEFSPYERMVVENAVAAGAGFIIVDEGPGLSGSSFLSVAEALENAGAAPGKIILLCSHEPGPENLCSTNAAQRWARFRHVSAAEAPRRPSAAEDFIGAGQWRSRLFADEACWPESWTSLERLKYISRTGARRLFKFTGLGHYGDPALEREAAVAAAGYGPAPQRESDGFVSYPWLEARPMSAHDLSSPVLARLAGYCAFRAAAFAAVDADPRPVEEMATHNLQELDLGLPVALRVERPVIADGRMQAHEWLLTATGEMLKTDSGSHGDDHFFPGPADIAWDLAGAIVEWGMNAGRAGRFLELYKNASGDNAAARIADFVRAYTVFRCAYCKMAGNAMSGTAEQARMDRAAAHYTAMLPALRAASAL